MASSYTTSFGIEKIGSGDQSGAWGTTTNHNFDILDRIASFKAVGLSGSTHTLTVREASPDSGTENLQDGMFRVIQFTGALGANNTVTVAPNTTSAYFIMINSTTDSGSSGPYSVIVSQGSGANITIANGKSAIVYMDGAGSGAAVVDAISNLQLATLTASGDITSAGTVNVTGDTAAGDDAAIGFTAAEGLILTGQGSTNDVTIKNDADQDVLEIPTGTTNVTVVGSFSAGTLTVGSGSITDSSGAIDFGNENLATTGTLSAGAGTVTSLDAGSGTIKTTGTIELGHATDTTLSRSAAGFLAVEGNDVLMASVDDVLSAGFSATADDDGTKSSGTYTPATTGGNYKTIVNGGAFTLAPQTTVSSIVIQVTNNSSAGTVTTSGFTIVTGDSLTTVDGDDFFLFSTVIGSFKHLNVVALQ
tara:strand:- start:280 stop:1536 length:1257 start_codon:yes stop_codon:yes gene_type:complete